MVKKKRRTQQSPIIFFPKRPTRARAGLALSLVAALCMPSCLQESDLSADALTSFEAPPPDAAGVGAQPAGAMANAAINGTAPEYGGEANPLHEAKPEGFGSTDETAESPAEDAALSQLVHEEKPAGFGSTIKEVSADAPLPEQHAHEEKPAGFGSTIKEASAEAPSPEQHAHEEKPAGFGSTQPASSTSTAGKTATAPEGAPEGAPEAHPHKEMPPGFGSTLPAEPKPAPVAAAGQTDPVKGAPPEAPPAAETTFERDYKGKKMVSVTGTLTYAGTFEGDIDLDCFVPDASAPGGRRLVNKVKLQKAGPYSFKVPAGFGPLVITGFIDLNKDGPDKQDPQTSFSGNPLQIKTKDISGVDLNFKAPGSKTP